MARRRKRRNEAIQQLPAQLMQMAQLGMQFQGLQQSQEQWASRQEYYQQQQTQQELENKLERQRLTRSMMAGTDPDTLARQRQIKGLQTAYPEFDYGEYVGLPRVYSAAEQRARRAEFGGLGETYPGSGLGQEALRRTQETAGLRPRRSLQEQQPGFVGPLPQIDVSGIPSPEESVRRSQIRKTNEKARRQFNAAGGVSGMKQAAQSHVGRVVQEIFEKGQEEPPGQVRGVWQSPSRWFRTEENPDWIQINPKEPKYNLKKDNKYPAPFYIPRELEQRLMDAYDRRDFAPVFAEVIQNQQFYNIPTKDQVPFDVLHNPDIVPPKEYEKWYAEGTRGRRKIIADIRKQAEKTAPKTLTTATPLKRKSQDKINTLAYRITKEGEGIELPKMTEEEQLALMEEVGRLGGQAR